MGFPFSYGQAAACLSHLPWSPSFLLRFHPSSTSNSPHAKDVLSEVPMHYAAVPVRRPQKRKSKNSFTCVFHCSTFLGTIQQVSWGPWKAQSFHPLIYLQAIQEAKLLWQPVCLASWQAWQTTFGSLVIFIKEAQQQTSQSFQKTTTDLV